MSGQYGAQARLWHFAINAIPMLGEPSRLRLIPHVVYSDPTGEKPDTAEHRRAHCKLWFNAKWRDLLYAGAALIAEPDGLIHLPLGGTAEALVELTSQTAKLPIRPSGRIEANADEINEVDGDAADLDVSQYEKDPAFSMLIDDAAENDSDAAADEAFGEEGS